jgi:predicted nucleotidyltransferase
MDREAVTVAARVATHLLDQGAKAVIIAGSFVLGEATRDSDIDLYVIGIGPDYQLFRRGGFLISISYRTPDAVRSSFREPLQVGSVIPGWRQAVILEDPEGLARELQREAEQWTWDVVGAESCDRAVAEEIVGLAEEVHKLVASCDARRTWLAAVQRNVLASHLAFPLSIYFRILYGSENLLWELVASRMNERWKRVQENALGLECAFQDSCAAALELYWMAVRETWELMSSEQREVVAHACLLAGYDLVGGFEQDS